MFSFIDTIKLFDLVFFILLFFSFFRGYKRGIIGTFLTYIFFILKFMLSYFLSATLGNILGMTNILFWFNKNMNVQTSDGLYQLIAFLLILLVLSQVFKKIVKRSVNMFPVDILNKVNQLLGGIFGALLFIVIALLFYYLLLSSVFENLRNLIPDSNVLSFFEWLIYN